MRSSFVCCGIGLALWLGSRGALAQAGPGHSPGPAHGPTIELAPADEPKSAIPRPDFLRLPREQQIEVSLSDPSSLGTAIGGYGELVLNAPSNATPVIDLRRLVLYFGHNFTERLRLYTEVEIEHAVASSQDRGEIEVEQAFLDYLAWRPLNFRAGVIIMPIGIINIYHEPASFNGADRPETDTLIIPSTWREPGAGVFGAWCWLRYQAYAVNGLNASGFSPNDGLQQAKQEAQLALGHDWGVVARLDAVPVLSLDLAASFYYSHADQGQQTLLPQGGNISVTIAEGDAHWKWRGIDARGEVASVWIGGAAGLDQAMRAMGTLNKPFAGPVAQQLLGGYVEAGYNVLQQLKLRSGMSLVPFLRYEHVDTQFRVPDGFDRVPGDRHDTLTAGLVFRPIAEVALKFDYQRRWTDALAVADAAVDRYNAALAFTF